MNAAAWCIVIGELAALLLTAWAVGQNRKLRR